MTLRSLTIAISNTMALTSTTFSKRIKKEQLQVYEGTHSYSQPTKSPVNSENYIPLKIGVFVQICCMQKARLIL